MPRQFQCPRELPQSIQEHVQVRVEINEDDYSGPNVQAT
jgi:hypothetical protein